MFYCVFFVLVRVHVYTVVCKTLSNYFATFIKSVHLVVKQDKKKLSMWGKCLYEVCVKICASPGCSSVRNTQRGLFKNPQGTFTLQEISNFLILFIAVWFDLFQVNLLLKLKSKSKKLYLN